MHTLQVLQQILQRTPTFVWGILAFCLAMGLLQRRDQQLSRTRLIAPSAGWAAFGLWGVSSAFGLHGLPLLAWALALAATAGLLRGRSGPAGVRFDADSGRYHVPGSWVPMALILGIFGAKYAVGVSLGLSPRLAQQPVFAAAVCALYGALSGLFIARTLTVLDQGPTRATGLQAA